MTAEARPSAEMPQEASAKAKRPRVVHLSTFHRSSDMRIFHKECRSLAAAGFEVHWVAPEPAPEPLDGVIFHPVKDCFYPYGLRRLWASSRDAWRIARDLDADLYHFHDTLLIPVGSLLRLRRRRVIFDVHEDAVPQALSLGRDAGKPLLGVALAAVRWVLEAYAKLFWSAFVCVTPHIAKKFPARRTVMARNFPLREEVEALVEAGEPYAQRPPEVLYVGGITAIRGAREMVAAAGRWQQAEARLVLVGPFAEESLEAELQGDPAWDRVEALGYQLRPGVLRALGRARVGLAVLHPRPNYQLAYPVKLFEYMAAGIPVVVSDFPLWRSIVESADCGLVVDPLDPEAIAAAVDRLLENPQEAEAMGQRGRKAVMETFNWSREAETLSALYRRLMGE
ncbi:MAG: glycosyltransferase family 4 protein [Acidobacteriota bacterium]